MEYVEGRTLDKLIADDGLELSQVLRYAVDIADAFAKAHAAGVIHRDLKPGNIMVARDGAVPLVVSHKLGQANAPNEAHSVRYLPFWCVCIRLIHFPSAERRK
jgi:serine/threonine protein kinase